MTFRLGSCLLALLAFVHASMVAPTSSLGSTRANDLVAPLYRIGLGRTPASDLVVEQRNGIVIAATYRRVTAYDARTGTRLWSRDDVHDPTLTDGAIYGSLFSTKAGASHALLALAPRTGATIWKSAADVSGPILVDDAGIVAGGFRSIDAFDFHGKPRWSRPSYGGFVGLLRFRDWILATSVRSGAILHGEFERFDRSSGVRRGPTQPSEPGPGRAITYFGPLLDVRAGHAYGANDFGAEYDTHCTKRDVLDVDLATMTFTRMTYAIDRPPAAAPSVCIGAREERPNTTIANGIVALGSGTLTAFYRTGSTTPIVPVLHEATLVGGPFAGYYYVDRPHGLDALHVDSAGVHVLHVPVRAPHAAVAGIADRLYVAAGDRIEAFAAGHFGDAPLQRYAARCPGLVAVGRTAAVDLLICRDEPYRGTASVIALPRFAPERFQGIGARSADFAR